jgi:SAM-dependent methyltransferase
MKAVTCNFCGRDEYRVRFPAIINNQRQLDVDAFRCTSARYGTHAQIVQCRHCGHVYANPRWSAGELIEAYIAVEDETYLAEQVGREQTFARHLASLERYTGPGYDRPLLDVGAYAGIFVKVALAAGWQATGVEPSRWAVNAARKSDLLLIEGTLDAVELRDRRFDVLTMWDVIEHVPDPSAELAKAFRLLNPGGVIAVHTMDIASPTARLMGRRWPWLMDMHVHYFSRRSLEQFLEKAGFEIIWSGSQGRYLSLGYLVTRVGGMSRPFGRLLGGLVNRARIEKSTVPVNFGDLFTTYARRPKLG